MSLLDTRMQNMRSQANLDKWETRPSRYGAFDVFAKQTEDPAGILAGGDLKEKAIKSIGSLLQVPVYDYDGTVTIGNTRTVTIADSENTSRMVTIAFATYSWGFTIVPTMFNNNEHSMQADFNQKMKKYLYKFAETVDGVALAQLEAKKTQVLGDPLLYTFASNVLSCDFDDRDEVMGDINPMMHSNDFYGDLHVVGNTGIESRIRKLAEQGLFNQKDKTLQYADKSFHFTNNLANAVGKLGTGFAINSGSLGILHRFERDAVAMTKSRTGHEWGIDMLPMLNLPVGTYYYESVGDYSAIAGAATADMTRTLKQHYGFSVDLAFVVAENSDPATLASPILKLDVARPA